MTTLNMDGTPRNGGRLRADYVDDVERAWFPLLAGGGIVALRNELVRQGVAPAKAAAIALFVHDHAERQDDGLSQGTRANYRRELAECSPGPRAKFRAIPGYVKLAA